MIISLPKATKQGEDRLPTTPEKIKELCSLGHEFRIEHDAGAGIGISDEAFASIGKSVQVLPAQEITEDADLIYTVKEPTERDLFYQNAKPGVHIFCYFHQLTEWQRDLLKRLGAVTIAYENVVTKNGFRPLLAPMSRVAAYVCLLNGLNYIKKLPEDDVTLLVLGSEGIGGQEAIERALAWGLDHDHIIGVDRAEKFTKKKFYEYITEESSPKHLEALLPLSDIVISALKQGSDKAPKLITQQMLAKMKRGSIICDMSIDEGGVVEGGKPTTHENPIMMLGHVAYYGVTNMPSAKAETSTNLLAEATFPYLKEIGENYPLTQKTDWNASELMRELEKAVTFY